MSSVPEQDVSVQPQFNAAYVWTISMVAGMGGLLFGYDWVVIGGAKPFFEKWFQLDSGFLSGWANSCALLGCLLGALITGGLSDKFGRKKLLLLAAFLFGVSSLLTGWAPTFAWFVVWRILGGVSIGFASVLSPMYIAEVAPAHMRGRLVAINQLMMGFGVLAAQILNWLIARNLADGATAEMIRQSWYGQYAWRWMFTAVACPSIVFFLSALFVPESPRWLIKNGLIERARRILGRTGGAAYADAEVLDIQNTLASAELGRVRFQDLLEPKVLRILMVGISLAVFQQFVGVNVLFNYPEEIFREAGYGVTSTLLNVVLTGVVSLVFIMIAIQTVDLIGRRALMLIGFAGVGICHALIGLGYLFHLKGFIMVFLVLAAISAFAVSLAPVTWVLISEIFPNRIRGAAVSVAVSALWIASFIVTDMFPVVLRALGSAPTFWLFAAICAAGFVFVFVRVPETKGKSLEQIERDLVD